MGLETLMITARAVDGSADLERVSEINKELTKVIGDFVRAVDVKALRSAKNSGMRSLSPSGDSPFSVHLCSPEGARARRTRSLASAA